MEKQRVFGRNSNEFERGNHSVGISLWHFEWCPKYRFEVMGNVEVRAIITACIRQAATSWKIKIIELNVQSNHIHLTAQIPLTMTPSSALHKLRGISSRKIFEKVPEFKRLYWRGHLWSRGKFAASLGFISVDAANKYVREQDEHHDVTRY